MDALQRLQYLQAMDVPVYRARRPLPGAKRSLPLPLPQARVLQRSTEPHAEVAVPRVAPPANPSKPVVETPAIAPPASADTPAITTQANVQQQTVRYQLMVVSNRALMVVADLVGVSRSERGPLEQLVVNIASALSREDSYSQFFQWPLQNAHPELNQGAEAARDTLGAMLEKLGASHPEAFVLVLGEGAGRCLDVAKGADQWRGRPLWVDVSPADLLAEPTKKRELWAQMQRLNSHGGA